MKGYGERMSKLVNVLSTVTKVELRYDNGVTAYYTKNSNNIWMTDCDGYYCDCVVGGDTNTCVHQVVNTSDIATELEAATEILQQHELLIAIIPCTNTEVEPQGEAVIDTLQQVLDIMKKNKTVIRTVHRDTEAKTETYINIKGTEVRYDIHVNGQFSHSDYRKLTKSSLDKLIDRLGNSFIKKLQWKTKVTIGQ